MRIIVETIFEYFSNGDTVTKILEVCQFLEKDDIQASITFANN